MTPNPGYCPAEAVGKRVRVTLRNGEPGRDFSGVDKMVAEGWAADGKHGCRWTKRGHPFDIAEYEVIG